MTAFKQFKTSDILVTSFKVNKHFTFDGASEFEDPQVEINRLIGDKPSILNTIIEPQYSQGTVFPEYTGLIYNSIKHLFYSNYQTSSFGDQPFSGSLIPGVTEGDLKYTGEASSQGRYYNYLQSSITFPKKFKDFTKIALLSIPKKLYGEEIFQNSFNLSWDGIKVKDDGEGNLFLNDFLCGNIFYSQGLVVIFENPSEGVNISNFSITPNVSCSFSSSLTIYETQYKCTLKDSEFNLSLNPSLISSSILDSDNINEIEEGGKYLDFVTGSDFNPYITEVGLYNDEGELLIVSKLSYPVPSSKFNDTTIIINLDQ